MLPADEMVSSLARYWEKTMSSYLVSPQISLRAIPSQLAILLAVTASLLFANTANAAPESPFKVLIGSWGGSGIAKFQDGTSQRLRCNAYYTGGGSRLGLVIRCKSSTQKIEVRSKMSYSAGRLSGTWVERTYNAEGKIKGRAKPGKLKFSIAGTISGTMTVAFDEKQQDVSISMKGLALKRIKVSLSPN